MGTAERYTTREIAERLNCPRAAALQLLKAAHIPCERQGTFLWDAASVDRLVSMLQYARGSSIGDGQWEKIG
jgi:hypothetical protein